MAVEVDEQGKEDGKDGRRASGASKKKEIWRKDMEEKIREKEGEISGDILLRGGKTV